MDTTTTHTPADVRERVARECVEEAERLRYWYGEWYARAQRLLREAAALLRTPRGEGEAWPGDAENDASFLRSWARYLRTEAQDIREAQDLPDWKQQAEYTEVAAARMDQIANRIAALRSDAQGEDRWEDLIFSTLIDAYNEAHAARRSDAQEKEDALVCASCGEPIGDEPTVIWQDAYTHYRCTPKDAIRDDTPVIRPIDAARRGEGGRD